MSFVSEFPHDEIESVLGDVITFFGYGEPVQVTGRFTNEFIEQHETSLVHPVFECQQVNVPNIKQGDLFSQKIPRPGFADQFPAEYDVITYRVADLQPDGQGLVVLILEQTC